MTKQERKEKIKNLLIEHLTKTIGYPNCQPELVINQLKPMWLLLEESGLLEQGMTFNGFVSNANEQLMLMKMKNFFSV